MPAPFTVSAVGFGFPGNPGSIRLRDPATLAFLGEVPEWSAGGAPAPAAFVRGSRPRVRVVFSRGAAGAGAAGGPDPSGTWRISAQGRDGPGISPQDVSLTFDESGHSAPVDFELDPPLPEAIGTLTAEWSWSAGEGTGSLPIGLTRHQWYLAWQAPIPVAVWATRYDLQGLVPLPAPAAPAWTWLPVMQWTCQWAAGKDDEEAICDAIFEGLPSTNLRYAVGAWSVLAMLQRGGGYCGGWSRMFQAMAGAHGITVERRLMAVDWREQREHQARWCAIVVGAPGLNREEPAEAASTFHDVDESPIRTSPVEERRQRRYRFWGIPGKVFDGHCLSFLRSRGRWILYDASFMHRVELGEFSLPASNPTRPVAVEELGDFKEAYLDRAVHFMLGSLEHDGKLFETRHPHPEEPGFHEGTSRNGLTLETALLPNRDGMITFYWI